MKTTAEYIDALRVKLDVDSDFLAMHALGVDHRTQVSRWRKCKGTFDKPLCKKVADALEIPREEVLLAMEYQRESDTEIKKLWQRIADAMHDHSAIAAAVLVVLALPFVSFDGLQYGLMAASTAATSPTVYIMTNGLLQYWPVFLALFGLMAWAFHGHNATSQESRTKRPD